MKTKTLCYLIVRKGSVFDQNCVWLLKEEEKETFYTCKKSQYVKIYRTSQVHFFIKHYKN